MTWRSDPAMGCGLMLLGLFVVGVLLAAFALAWVAGTVL